MVYMPRGLNITLLFLAGILAISGCSNRPKIDAVQRFYTDGVPHSDGYGQLRRDYDEGESFLPLGLYHALSGEHHGTRFTLKDVSAAGFNVVHPWEGQAAQTFLKRASEEGLKVILHWRKEQDIATLAKNGSLLAWYLDEEPSFRYSRAETENRLKKHDELRAGIRRYDQERPIIVIDGPPTSKNLDQWKRWNAIGDLSSHFNYPVTVEKYRDYGAVERVAETTTMARRLIDDRKPVWIVLQAFGGEARGWRMPDPASLRAMAYAAIIHGATGLIYFAFDSFVTRDDGVLGIAPAPVRNYRVARDYNTDGKPPLIVADGDIENSKRLFSSVSKLNGELAQLREAVLSATSPIEYDVGRISEEGREDAVRTLLKPYGNAHLLFAVNVETEQTAVRLRFAQKIASVAPLFGSSPPVINSDDGFSDRFSPEEVKIYRIVFSE